MATAFKQVKNNAKSIVNNNVLNNTTTTLSVGVEDGSRFPSFPGNSFYVTSWNVSKYFDPNDDPNMRIGLCTARTGNNLTITWGQEGTPVNAIKGRPAIAILVLDKNLQDIYDAVNLAELSIAGNDTNALHKTGSESANGFKTFLDGIASRGESQFSNGTFTDPHSGNAYDAKFGGAGNGIAVRGASRFLSPVTFPSSGIVQAAIANLPGDLAARAFFAGDLGGSAATPLVKSRSNTFTIGAAGTIADYVCTGTHDGAVFKTAIAALPASGGKIIVRPGTYNWDDSTDRVFLTKSNVTIEAETYGSVTFKATASLHPGGSDAQGRFGLFNIGHTSTTPVNNIIFRNIIIDINHVAKSAGLTLSGGTNPGVIGLSNVLLDKVRVKNHALNPSDKVEAGLFLISGNVTSYGNLGYMDRVKFQDVEVDGSYLDGMWILGGNFTNMTFNDLYVHDNNGNGVDQVCYDTAPTSANWTIYHSRFLRNMLLTFVTSHADWRDDTQVGVDNLTFDLNYFGPTSNPGSDQDFSLTPYQAQNLRITRNLFDRVGAGVSLGASLAGSAARIFPTNKVFFEGNVFYQARSCFDPDSNIFASFKNNIFYEVKKFRNIGGYSRHFPTVVDGNIFYNCHITEDGTNGEYNRAAIAPSGDGWFVSNNWVIDDRKIPDPIANVTLGSTAGGALGARTYYVRYAWENSSGETTNSWTEQTISLLANTLLTVSVGFGDIPSGARKLNIYVSTTSSSETLQGFIPQYSIQTPWVEPTSGLVAGTAYPTTNTTTTKTKYGIYELPGGPTLNRTNRYHNNYTVGIDTPIKRSSQYRAICTDNFADPAITGGDEYSVEKAYYDVATATGAQTMNPINFENQRFYLTGNVTFTFTGGDYIGQTMKLTLIQDATGNRTATWPSNFKKSGGTLTLSTAGNAVDAITMQWDGTNWNEIGRALNIG